MYGTSIGNSIAGREECGVSGDTAPVRMAKVFSASREETR